MKRVLYLLSSTPSLLASAAVLNVGRLTRTSTKRRPCA